MNSNYIGVYSPKAAEKYGSVYYFDHNMIEHEVTSVYSDLNHVNSYDWDDKKVVSTSLTTFSRTGRPSTVSLAQGSKKDIIL